MMYFYLEMDIKHGKNKNHESVEIDKLVII